MPNTKVKICGITNIEDALAAVAVGADAIGLVFYARSSRYVTCAQAAEIVAAVGPLVTTVGLFVNEPLAELTSIARATGIHLVQLHGDENPAYCAQLTLPYLKAIRMAPEVDASAAVNNYPGAAGVLFDGWQKDAYGGTGQQFDWQRVMHLRSRPVIVAGGLNAGNVSAAIAAARPYAVDVSSGVESAPGRKDLDLMTQFVALAKAAP